MRRHSLPGWATTRQGVETPAAGIRVPVRGQILQAARRPAGLALVPQEAGLVGSGLRPERAARPDKGSCGFPREVFGPPVLFSKPLAATDPDRRLRKIKRHG